MAVPGLFNLERGYSTTHWYMYLEILDIVIFQMFRLKAEEVARKLLPAFSTSTGIPKSLINFKTWVQST